MSFDRSILIIFSTGCINKLCCSVSVQFPFPHSGIRKKKHETLKKRDPKHKGFKFHSKHTRNIKQKTKDKIQVPETRLGLDPLWLHSGLSLDVIYA